MKSTKIKLDEELKPLLRSMGVNWMAQKQKPFDLQPATLKVTLDGLKPKSFPRAAQIVMMQSFLDRPHVPGTFAVMSHPTDGKAVLLAAWMMQQAYRAGITMQKWYDVTGGFDCPLLQERANIGLLVLNNVGPDSSQTKKEKLRDLLVTYADIPKVVVVNGCDPYTFFTVHMRMPLTGLCYITNKIVKSIDV